MRPSEGISRAHIRNSTQCLSHLTRGVEGNVKFKEVSCRPSPLSLYTVECPSLSFVQKKDCKSELLSTLASQAAHVLRKFIKSCSKKADKKCPWMSQDDFTKLKKERCIMEYCPGNPDSIGLLLLSSALRLPQGFCRGPATNPLNAPEI